MSWSLKNHLIAGEVQKLVDRDKDAYPPEVKRRLDRETTLAVIHATLWAYGVREDSFAGAYAMHNLYEALGLNKECKQ